MSESLSTAQFFTEDHNACDALWAEVEAAAGSAKLGGAYARFKEALVRHLAMEEEVLFPWFEARTGMAQGPTTVMRNEHQQMRAVLTEMDYAAGDGDSEGVMDHGDTLLMLIQQHNVKEESMLYPMCDRAASPDDLAGLQKKLARYQLSDA
jgi:iron-sulfur cluster repair protein YtfE (RIC family)